jgi:hypothetical protein
MATNDRAISRLILQIERGETTLRHLSGMAFEIKSVVDVRRGELRAVRAIVAARKAKKKPPNE